MLIAKGGTHVIMALPIRIDDSSANCGWSGVIFPAEQRIGFES